MLSSTPITLDAFRRLPGLYRSLRPGEHCHPEDAGSLQDDTPLLAVCVGEPVSSAPALGTRALASSRGRFDGARPARIPLLPSMATSSGAGR